MSNYYAIPAAEDGLSIQTLGNNTNSNGEWKKIAENSEAYSYIYGITFQYTSSPSLDDSTTNIYFDIATNNEGIENAVITVNFMLRADTRVGFYMPICYSLFLPEPFTVAPFANVLISARLQSSDVLVYNGVKLLYRSEKPMISPSVFNHNIENFKSVSAGSGISVSERTW